MNAFTPDRTTTMEESSQLHGDVIFRKTPRGTKEVEQRQLNLGSRERLLLVLANGTRKLGEISGPSRDWRDVAARLLLDGLIETVSEQGGEAVSAGRTQRTTATQPPGKPALSPIASAKPPATLPGASLPGTPGRLSQSGIAPTNWIDSKSRQLSNFMSEARARVGRHLAAESNRMEARTAPYHRNATSHPNPGSEGHQAWNAQACITDTGLPRQSGTPATLRDEFTVADSTLASPASAPPAVANPRNGAASGNSHEPMPSLPEPEASARRATAPCQTGAVTSPSCDALGSCKACATCPTYLTKAAGKFMKESAIRLAGPARSVALADLLERCHTPDDITVQFDHWLRVLLTTTEGQMEAPPLASYVLRLLRPSTA